MTRIGAIVSAALAVTTALGASACGGSEARTVDLAVVSTRDGDYAIYGMDSQGRGQSRLTEERGDPSTARGLFFQLDPTWSPDGRKIAFASRRAGSFDIYVMNADGSGTRRLTSTPDHDTSPTWSPDGRRIAFDRGQSGDLYVMNADGSGAHRVSTDLADEKEPAWSPDGHWIAYVRRTPGTAARELWLVRPDGTDRHAVTSSSWASYSPSWSPDSTRLVFAAAINAPTYDLYTVRTSGRGMRRLTSSPEDALEPAWSPDGKTIAFERGGSIVTVGLDGRVATITDAENNDSSPAWNPRPLPDDE